MIEILREVQLPVISAALLLAALTKFADRSTQGQGPQAVLLPSWLHRPSALAIAATEAIAGVLLLLCFGALGDIVRAATVALFAVATAALIQTREHEPEKGCGCFGGLSTTPVGWRTISRAALFAVAAAVTVGVTPSGLGVLTQLTLPHLAVMLGEVALIAVLSPEFKELIQRLYYRDPCDIRDVPLNRSLARLYTSDAWREHVELLDSSEPVDVWRQKCLRFLRFRGTRAGRPADVIFAVPLSRRRSVVRSVVLDTTDSDQLV
ncbi:MauE/DoxX family redox-associated membrane protein [Salinactinospora qingdaonensis]|uniref:Methylamine utilisation protein MauE domain-containing protein n=1 Tax=Salinactinospora qingdaonensis TaxID=702744 RepID=A0ABP7F4W2_9ACTN